MLKSQTKILYLVTQSDFGGAQRYVFDLATNFKQNYEIIVAGGQPGDQRELAKRLAEKNIKYTYLSHVKRAINPWHDFFALWQIVKLIKKEQPDIIHLNSSKISILGSLAYKLYSSIINQKSSIKNIYTVHGWVFNEEIPAWQKIFYKFSEKLTAKFKTKIICLSEFDKTAAIKNKIVRPKKISIIHNGIHEIKFLPREEARKKLGIPNNSLVIGAIGNLYKNKGYEYLIKAVKKLQVTSYKLQVSIIGDGPEMQSQKSKVKNLKLEDNVKLTGTIKNASQYLKAFDIYVSASIKEGLPYAVLEAMQTGLPVVATKVGAVPEVIMNKNNGLLVEPKNPEQLAEKIQYLIDNPDIAKRLSEQARKDVKEKFSLEKMIVETEKLYAQN